MSLTSPLKKLTGIGENPRNGFKIMRYWHPDSRKGSEFVKFVETLEEAQEHCSDPSSSYKIGPTSGWYFDGYVEAGSASITLW